ncbi:hypothetical protein CWI75_02075 [Kineobactrum sediminis]|uniref:DUF3187 domain-containing protein n=1 Tax=Kineobactrum sediminis TaxID=1905677 RepID=A0A2N5Y6Y4_9GAMM|nr:DUF3187 family protein [Kineobactrum sediminis]PLW84158.1 hypothetical protein CWI75_02075 [Kineobactrum sediminis]
MRCARYQAGSPGHYRGYTATGLRAGLFALLTVLPLVALPARGAEPLYSKNLSPVAGLLGLPSPRSAALAAEGDWQLAMHGSIASHFVLDSDNGEALNLDGETYRVAMDLRYGFSPGWELQLEVPWLGHSGGSLDSAIDNWHDLWRMPDGGRSRVPRDLLDFSYRAVGSRFALTDDASGVGDITLALNRTLFTGSSLQLSAGLGYKFATGRERELLGSGAEDGFIALRAGWVPAGSPFSAHAQAGYLRAGHSRVLANPQERNLWFAGAGLNWRALDALSLIVQLDSHSAPMESRLAALGDTALLLSVGGRWQMNPRWALDISVVEDVAVATGPDIIFQASLRFTPSGAVH